VNLYTFKFAVQLNGIIPIVNLCMEIMGQTKKSKQTITHISLIIVFRTHIMGCYQILKNCPLVMNSHTRSNLALITLIIPNNILAQTDLHSVPCRMFYRSALLNEGFCVL
jgi:hypothetical protein